MDWSNLPQMLEGYNIQPNVKNLHQYFLIDEEMLDDVIAMANIDRHDTVVEIGAGVGNITELLARKAKRVIAYEIDVRFRVFLEPLVKRHNNLRVYFEDIKKAKWPRFNRLVANVPFNTLEPILPKLAQTKFRNAILIVGDRFRSFVVKPLSEDNITKLGVVVRAFFSVKEICVIERDKFYPRPNTDAIVIELKHTNPCSPFLQFCRNLLMNQDKLVQHILKMYEAPDRRRRTRKNKVDIPVEITKKRVDRLSNNDFQRLFMCFLND